MQERNEDEAPRPARPMRDQVERAVGDGRADAERYKLRQATDTADGANIHGVTWRWQIRRKRER